MMKDYFAENDIFIGNDYDDNSFMVTGCLFYWKNLIRNLMSSLVACIF